MTLKERFRQGLTGQLSDEKTEVDVNIAMRIAEEFAIGFAEWFHKNFQNQGIQIYTRFGRWEKVTIEEALEIYKKEKGL